MHQAACYGNEKVLELFLSCPYIQDKNPKDDHGDTPMQLAESSLVYLHDILKIKTFEI